MRVRDLKLGDTFHHVGGNRKYILEDDTPEGDNDIWVRCTHISVPYVIDLDVEVERINESS